MKNMKKLSIFTVILTALILQSGCYADKGNYDYRDINELTIILPATREVRSGHRLFIEPEIISSILSHGNIDSDNYTFLWRAVRNNNSGLAYTLGRELNLDTLIPLIMQQGDYVLFYTITSRRTGIATTETLSLRITGGLTVGWLILNDINGSSRLDMLPLNDSNFSFVKDLFTLIDDSVRLPAERMQSRPLGLRRFPCFLSPDLLAFYILTETHSSRIRLRYFTWRENFDVRNHFVPPSLAPPNFAMASLPRGTGLGGDIIFIMTGKDASGRLNVYYFNRNTGMVLWSSPANTLDLGRTFFNISSKHTDNLIFDDDTKSIYELRENASRNGVGAAFIDEGGGRNILRPYRNIRATDGTPMELVEMLSAHQSVRPEGADIWYKFIFKNPTNGEQWILRSLRNMSQTHWQRMGSEIAGSTETIDWSQVQLYTIGGDFSESLYFALGGKVYVYNVPENRSYLMLDKGSNYEITFLDFFPGGGTGNQGSRRDIFVGSFDGTHGTLERYQIFIRPNPFVIARFGKNLTKNLNLDPTQDLSIRSREKFPSVRNSEELWISIINYRNELHPTNDEKKPNHSNFFDQLPLGGCPAGNDFRNMGTQI
jgi:hypothetical protein